MKELMFDLIRVDADIRRILLQADSDSIKGSIRELLAEAVKDPGRRAKLLVTYILERAAELANDLYNEEDGFFKKFDDCMKWIDRGLKHAAYLANPESAGRFLEAFDQTVIRVHLEDPKDPKIAEERREKVKDIRGRWDQAVEDAKRPRPGGGNVIVPGS
jgi:hypothetical protein